MLDLGTDGTASVDYPDYGYALAEALADGRAERGIALCGSGIGIAIAANRIPACRCALVSEPLSARLARDPQRRQRHRDRRAADRRGDGQGLRRRVSLTTEFAGGRHQHRVDKLVRKEPA